MIVDFHNHFGTSRDGASITPQALLEQVRMYGITRAVVFPVDEEDTGETYSLLNDQVIAWVNQHPEFIGFCRVNPHAGEAALAELRRCAQAGLAGLKLHPRSESFEAKHAAFLLEEAQTLQLPVIIHQSHEPHCQPRKWEASFARFRHVQFILAHSGKDKWNDAVEVAQHYDNVYLETSTLSYNRTKQILAAVGPEKIVFGSDAPYSHHALELAKFELLASERDRHIIFCENAKHILPDHILLGVSS